MFDSILKLWAEAPLAILIPAGLIVLLVLRRLPIVGPVVNLAVWLAIGAGLYFALDQRARLDPYLGSIAGLFDKQEVVGRELRIRMAPDGHFWANVRFGGIERRMLVDSGATFTAISSATAGEAGLAVRQEPFPLLIRTANGTIAAQSSEIGEMRLGNIVARDLAVVVSPAFGETNVIGMNFLSRLQSWRVEGRTLVLVPHHPQGAG
ncbi:retropepsin-like aspartic protease family protein [Sphingomonas profundi]|uniref:retropepsin-like aspartic protease family protein n=1 Tax=Alterirhizorhabdus profundi TaxID=2681549 RepID=UPI0012E71B2A|nr:retropepsin-like aspartic protease [Sphingomonas profundi]